MDSIIVNVEGDGGCGYRGRKAGRETVRYCSSLLAGQLVNFPNQVLGAFEFHGTDYSLKVPISSK